VVSVLLTALLVGTIAPAESPARAKTLGVDCSITGDVCVSAQRVRGRIKLMVRSFVNLGRYTLCLNRPQRKATCRRFRQRRADRGIFQSRIDWRRRFGFSRGRHRATWRASGAVRPLGVVRFWAGGRRHVSVRKCGGIAFTPRTENGVYDIRARGISCRRARRVARAVRFEGIVEGPYEYREAGFECQGRYAGEVLPSVDWRCTRKLAWITFSRA
jgi:hypothetical protein